MVREQLAESELPGGVAGETWAVFSGSTLIVFVTGPQMTFPADGVCLSCRAVPITDIIVELQEGDRLRQASPFGLKLAGH